MFHQIMVPLDGSDFGEQAIPTAVDLARRSGAALHLVHVLRPLIPPVVVVGVNPPLLEFGESDTQHYLDAIQARIPGDVDCTTRLTEGLDIAEALCSLARERAVDLVVMTTHGRGGLARAWLGSVADRVVRLAEIPVLLVRPREGLSEPPTETLFRRVLLPLEHCVRVEEVLEPALALGRLSDATYTLLHVITPSPPAHDHDPHERDERLRAEEAQAMVELQRVAATPRLDGERVEAVVVRHRSPALAILDHAARGYDLIALATHAHAPLTRLLLGGVADKVVRGATIPVLTVHASG